MKKLLEIVTSKKYLIILFLIVILYLLYQFIPRSLSNLCYDKKKEVYSISVILSESSDMDGKYKEWNIIEEDKIEKVKTLFKKYHVRPILIPKKYVNGGYEGIDMCFNQKNNKIISVNLFTDNIISINYKQYVFYSKGFASELKNIINNTGA